MDEPFLIASRRIAAHAAQEILLRAALRLSAQTRIGGFDVHFASDKDLRAMSAPLLAGLRLLEKVDPARMLQMHTDIDLVLVSDEKLAGKYIPSLRLATLDASYLGEENPAVVATALVELAVIGRFLRRVGWNVGRHSGKRVMKSAMRAQRSFAEKLIAMGIPGGYEILNRLSG